MSHPTSWRSAWAPWYNPDGRTTRRRNDPTLARVPVCLRPPRQLASVHHSGHSVRKCVSHPSFPVTEQISNETLPIRYHSLLPLPRHAQADSPQLMRNVSSWGSRSKVWGNPSAAVPRTNNGANNMQCTKGEWIGTATWTALDKNDANYMQSPRSTMVIPPCSAFGESRFGETSINEQMGRVTSCPSSTRSTGSNRLMHWFAPIRPAPPSRTL